LTKWANQFSNENNFTNQDVIKGC